MPPHEEGWRHGARAVDRVFGYPGDGIDGVLRRAGRPTFVQARHEENAGFMAVAHAKLTGGAGAPAPDEQAQEHGVIVTSPGLRPARAGPYDTDLRAAVEGFDD